MGQLVYLRKRFREFIGNLSVVKNWLFQRLCLTRQSLHSSVCTYGRIGTYRKGAKFFDFFEIECPYQSIFGISLCPYFQNHVFTQTARNSNVTLRKIQTVIQRSIIQQNRRQYQQKTANVEARIAGTKRDVDTTG